MEVILCAWHQGCRVQLCRVPDRQGRQVWLYWGAEVPAFTTPNSSACHQGALSTTSETPWGVHGEHCLPGPLAHHLLCSTSSSTFQAQRNSLPPL